MSLFLMAASADVQRFLESPAGQLLHEQILKRIRYTYCESFDSLLGAVAEVAAHNKAAASTTSSAGSRCRDKPITQ